jgi:hypothetical protein
MSEEQLRTTRATLHKHLQAPDEVLAAEQPSVLKA